MLGGMPRYFFILVYPNGAINDPRGTVLPSDEAAVAAARTIIDDLLEYSGPRQPRPIIMVRNEAGEMVYQFPAFRRPGLVEEMNDACFVVRDKNGQQLSFFYLEGGPRPAHGRQSAHQGRGPAAGGQLRQAAGAFAEAVAARGQPIAAGLCVDLNWPDVTL